MRFCVFLFLSCLGFFCTYSIKNPEILEEDPYFFPLEEGAKEADCNSKSIQFTRKAQLKEAMNSWENCLRQHSESSIIQMNHIRFYYLLEEYDELKKRIVESYKKENSKLYTNVLATLYEQNRWEERVILLDALSRIEGWEEFSWEELGKYYLRTGNLLFAERYFNQILELEPFHEEALFGMIEIQTEKEKWRSVLDLLNSLAKSAKKRKDFGFFGLKAQYELGNYEEAIKWVKLSDETEKERVAYLETWRDTLLILYEKPDWKPLIPYFRKAQKSGYMIPESVFFPTQGIDELRRRVRSGRG